MWLLWILFFSGVFLFLVGWMERLYLGYNTFFQFFASVVIVLLDFFITQKIYKFVRGWILSKASFKRYFRDFLV